MPVPTLVTIMDSGLLRRESHQILVMTWMGPERDMWRKLPRLLARAAS